MRVGRAEFEVDPARQHFDDSRYEQGRGLIGGDPRLRPAHVRWQPIPEEQPYFRLIDISAGKRARLAAFLGTAGDEEKDGNGGNEGKGGKDGKGGGQERPEELRGAEGATAVGPLEIEIGFGSGEFLLGRAAAHPERRFLGFEVKRDLCQDVVRAIEAAGLRNVWISDDDARWALPQLDLAGRVAVVHVLYPDPWWKRRHHAKRLFRLPFVALVHSLLEPGGLLHVRTDVEGYAELIRAVVAEHGGFSANDPALAELFSADPPTRREAFCRSIGRPYWVMGFKALK